MSHFVIRLCKWVLKQGLEGVYGGGTRSVLTLRFHDPSHANLKTKNLKLNKKRTGHRHYPWGSINLSCLPSTGSKVYTQQCTAVYQTGSTTVYQGTDNSVHEGTQP